MLSATSTTLLLLASIRVGIGLLDLPERWLGRVSSRWFVVVALQIGLWANLGESTLEFETVYIVLDASYNVYMDVQQRTNLKIMQTVADLDACFAFPSRTEHA